MDVREGDRKEQGESHIQNIEGRIAEDEPTDPRFWEDPNAEYGIDDPLAQLAVNLAIALLYIEENKGGFCDDCTCPGWHCTTETEECELCFCLEQHSNPLPIYIPSPRIPIKYSGTSTLYEPYGMPRGYSERGVSMRNERNKAAREALRELTE